MLARIKAECRSDFKAEAIDCKMLF